ncbi:hypothetical protein P175DRAFT_022911 [Aspergillus ochraceoroseus IBT 24754]|uniref:Uncharacterized protein n=1 Tax=Aspergillus ochraceoroseus IBT 24754 TaxID=1392256 RepID=A0A2T5M6N5_9EURO|nr:uncharacterized protein P175DRAFT_022911 [Aspergillus ochraceoroseus IBT 24754]PTU24198.1 hypothetical protein P175DRAFT_022911 [Aspergillus ochraceoroseus IBT 24754]
MPSMSSSVCFLLITRSGERQRNNNNNTYLHTYCPIPSYGVILQTRNLQNLQP